MLELEADHRRHAEIENYARSGSQRVWRQVMAVALSARRRFNTSSPTCLAAHSTPRLTASLQLTQLPRKLVPPRSARVPCCVFFAIPRIAAPAGAL